MASKLNTTLLGCAVILLGATGLQIFAHLNRAAPSAPPDFARSIPTKLPGWTCDELPLAETEELKNAVADILKFDEFRSLIYRNGGRTVTLYAAYWSDGKVPPRAVGVHTPDTCWVQNGWSRHARTSGVPVPHCRPAEFGTYSLRGNRLNVYFWHLVGGRSYAYEQEGLHSLTAPLKDLATFGLQQRREQLFVRLAANVPFEQLRDDPGYLALLDALARLGLRPD